MDAMLTRGAASRLRRTLIDEKGIASAISSYNLPARDGHAFALVVTLAKVHDIDAAEAALSAAIARLRNERLGAVELAAAKNRPFGDTFSAPGTARGRAWELGGGAQLTGDPPLPNKHP